jgi:signal peptidase I
LRRRRTLTVALGCLLAFSAWNIFFAVSDHTAFGLPTPYVVVSGSMLPKIKVGYLVVTQPISYGNIKVGDVIVYSAPDGLAVVHRVVAITPQGLITKGDANAVADEPGRWPPLNRSQVRGDVVLMIPYLGAASLVLSIQERIALALSVVCVLAAAEYRSGRKS